MNVHVYVKFKDGSDFQGFLCLNAFTGYLVFNNEYGQMNVEEKAIAYIDLLDS